MSLYVYPAWDFAQIGTMTVSVQDSTATYTVSVATGVYSHVTYASVVSAVSPFGPAFKAAMEAAATIAGSAHTFTVAYTAATRGYTITPDTGTIKFGFSGAAGTVAKNVLGLSGDTGTLSAITSNLAVYYALAGAEGAQTEVAEYEPPDLGDVGEADDGSTYQTARTTAPMYYDCTIPYETQAMVYTYALAGTNPWCWQMFFAHVRGCSQPYFGLSDSGTGYMTVHKMRKDGMSFVPEPPTGDKSYQAYMHIPLRTTVLGRVKL